MVVGYPLHHRQSKQCLYVENFIEYMKERTKVKTPLTLVDESNSSIEAKVEIAKKINAVPQIGINGHISSIQS